MKEPIEQREQLWTQFLQRWPLESLAQMTLSQYTQAGDTDCFTYWLEAQSESLGSIWGGSAFKFGIYSRRDQSEKPDGPDRRYSSDYAWYSQYGESADAAFARVKAEIVKVAQAARAGDLEAVDQAALGQAIKWKLAFLYQDRQQPCVLPIYTLRNLRAAFGEKNALQAPQLYRQLLAERGEGNLFAYADACWSKAQVWLQQQEVGEQAMAFFTEQPERFAPINATLKVAGFRLENGRQLALLRENKKLTLLMQPGDWLAAVQGDILSQEDYPADKSRNSNLGSCAPQLAHGQAALCLTLRGIDGLESLCSAYETGQVATVQSQPMAPGHPPMIESPLNQILYGPPGTGKTYATIEAALEILDPAALLGERAERKARFDELTREGRVRFVTFHQSFSYEDFVEGLRAEPAPADAEGASSGVQYRVEAGVFLRLCREAVRNRAFEQRVGVRDDAKVWKISIEEASSTGLTRKYCFEHGEARIGWSDVGDIRKANLSDPSLKLGTNDQSSLANFGLNVEPGDVVVCLSTTRQISAVGVVTGEYEYSPTVPVGVRKDYVHRLPVHWLATGLSFDITGLNQGVKLTLKTMYELWRISWPALQSTLLREGIALAGEFVQPEEAASQPYVLIIDEINRGNVSRILGELITLIEPSKRAGAEEALEVVLPYSKERFSVPGNVYLIGTMNTADRSLAGLDIALRRRFTFKEMPPQPELLDDVLVAGVNIGQLLRVVNQRIEVLLDRDHCLGHAYFIPLLEDRRLERLELIFRNQVLPLLQEYFFEDWQRIQWVLNDHRKEAADCFVYQRQRDVQTLFGDQVSVSAHNLPWRINAEAFGRVEAYLGIIDHAAQAPVLMAEREAVHRSFTICQLNSGSIQVLQNGEPVRVALPVLRQIAVELGVSDINGSGNDLNTRSLGRKLIDAIGNIGA